MLDSHHSSGSSAARATHPRLHIRNAVDAHTLFEAVRLGQLPIVRRRLSPTERELQSGEVFVWEEASYKGGLERWTDGRKWSQSRMREPFLFYEEKVMPSREEKDAKAARRARKSSDPCQPDLSRLSPTPSNSSNSSAVPFRRQDRPTKLKGLTKQTYSAYVTAPGSNGPPKKWHLTAYFCTTDYHELPVITDDHILRNISVPKGVYVTGKGLTRKSNRGVGANSSNAPGPTVSTSPTVIDDDRQSSVNSPAVSARTSFDSPATRPSSVLCPPHSMSTRDDSPATTAYVPATTPPSHLTPQSSVSIPSSRPGDDPIPALGMGIGMGLERGCSSPRWSTTPTPPPQQSSSSSYGSYPHHSQSYHYQPPPQPSHHYSYDPHSSYSQHYPQEHYHHTSTPSSSSYETSSLLPPLSHQPHPAQQPPSFQIPRILEQPKSFTPAPSTPLLPSLSSPVTPITFPGLGAVGYPSSDVRGELYQPPTSPMPSSASPAPGSIAGGKYLPRSSTDERALGAFRIAL